MSLTGVKMSEEVWLTCLTHTLSTETEEIMGLLLGDIQLQENGNVTALIWGALPQPRCDRQKDRVETNPEQLTAASLLAEKMTLETGTITRVIGWYHSHPHITVLPSHVDVRTQAMYQLMDSGFIGLIFSCFSEDAQKVGRIQVIAFQSLDGKQNHMSRPGSLSAIVDVESSFENSLSVYGSSKDELMEQDTADSRAIVLSTKEGSTSPHLGSLISDSDVRIKNYSPGSSSLNNNANSDLDPMDMSEGMQQAMHLSNLETSGAEYLRKEVPLYVVPASSFLNVNSPLSSFTNLQYVLYEEERTAYNQALAQIIRDGKVHPLSLIHHTSTYQASICKMIEYCLNPAISTLQDHLRENGIKLKMLGEEANILESEISGGNPESPSQSFTTHHLTEQTGMRVSGSRNRYGY